MSRSRAIRRGFAHAFQQPSLFLGELAWRWVFGISALLLTTYGVLLFLGSVKVTTLDLLGLYGIIPGQFSSAVNHIFSGSGPRLVRMTVAVAAGTTLFWWAASTLGRSAVLRVAMPHCEGDLRVIARLHMLRSLTGVALLPAYAGCIVLALAASRTPGGHDTNAFYGFLIPLLILLGIAWNLLSWYVSLAPIVALRGNLETWPALTEAIALSWRRSLQFTWVGFVFGCTRTVLAIACFILLLTGLGFASESSGWVSLGVMLLTGGTYFFLGDFLHLARLLAYIRLLDWDEEERNRPPESPIPAAPEPEAIVVPAM